MSCRNERTAWTAAYVEAVVHSRLADVLAPAGFVLKDEEFEREKGGVRQRVGVALVDYRPEFRIAIVFGLRVYAEAVIFRQFWPGTGYSDTCGFTLSDIAPEVEEDVIVRNVRELESALARLILPLEQVAVPMLDAHRDATAIERLFNDAAPAARIRTCDLYRLMSAIILAHLVRNPDRDRLMAEYRPRVERQGEDCRRAYDNLVEYLKSRPPGVA